MEPGNEGDLVSKGLIEDQRLRRALSSRASRGAESNCAKMKYLLTHSGGEKVTGKVGLQKRLFLRAEDLARGKGENGGGRGKVL